MRSVYSTRVFQAASPTAPCRRSGAPVGALAFPVGVADLKIFPRKTKTVAPAATRTTSDATSATGKRLARGSETGASGAAPTGVGRGLLATVAERMNFGSAADGAWGT